MRHTLPGGRAAAFLTGVFLSSMVAATAQIPGATNQPPVSPDLPNHPTASPFGLKLAVALVALLALVAAFYFALRAWRSSNLFQRQYQFPEPRHVPLRLGASRSGGRMATINFASNESVQSLPTNQRPEERPLQ